MKQEPTTIFGKRTVDLSDRNVKYLVDFDLVQAVYSDGKYFSFGWVFQRGFGRKGRFCVVWVAQSDLYQARRFCRVLN
jgi:hypothetical protein